MDARRSTLLLGGDEAGSEESIKERISKLAEHLISMQARASHQNCPTFVCWLEA